MARALRGLAVTCIMLALRCMILVALAPLALTIDGIEWLRHRTGTCGKGCVRCYRARATGDSPAARFL